MEFHPHTGWAQPRLASVLWLALLVDAVLVALHLAVPIATGHTVGFFNLGAERNLPTWWSSGKLAVAGILFALVAVRLRRLGSGSLFLGLLAASLLAMSLDELASIHEKIGLLVDGDARSETTYTVTGYWIVFLGVPAAIAIGLLLMASRRSLRAVPFTLARVALGFAVLFSGALIAETLTNFVERGSVMDRLQIALEEGLEMVGGTILLWAGAVFLVFHPSLPGLAKLVASTSLAPLPREHGEDSVFPKPYI